MINLLLGAPGGGKSYEAVVFHVLTALRQGRKVITNLPIFVDQIAVIEPRAHELIEHRTKHRSGQGWPFSTADEFGDAWRHPDSGGGALYIIDEAHKVLPRAETPRAVVEWFGEHRHELCDVLLVTQSYGKLDPDIRDMVQTVYRVRKKVAWGQPDRYIRKVQDGVRGEVMDISERVYERKYFKLYRSHTKSNGAGEEFGATDVSPRYKKFLRAGVAVCVLAVLFMGWKALRGGSPDVERVHAKARAVVSAPAGVARVAQAAPGAPVVRPAAVPVVVAPPEVNHPFKGLRMHVAGAVHAGPRFEYLFMLSQNGQVVALLRAEDLRQAGYGVEFVNECAAKITHEAVAEPWYARCDFPQVQAVRRVEG